MKEIDRLEVIPIDLIYRKMTARMVAYLLEQEEKMDFIGISGFHPLVDG